MQPSFSWTKPCCFSRVVGGFRRGDGGLLLRGGLNAESGALVRVRGPHVPRDLSSLLRDCRHVSNESQVSDLSSTSLFPQPEIYQRYVSE